MTESDHRDHVDTESGYFSEDDKRTSIDKLNKDLNVGLHIEPTIKMADTERNVRETSTQTDCDEVIREAVRIARDLLKYGKSLKNNTTDYSSRPPLSSKLESQFLSLYTKVLLDLVNEILIKHKAVYVSIVKSLSMKNGIQLGCLKIICDQLFQGNTPGNDITWGKIIALYALCVQLGRQCSQEPQDKDRYFQALYACDFIGTYMGEKSIQWIKKQGGWEAVQTALPHKSNVENVIWKGLLITGLSLGMLATFIRSMR